MYLPFHIVDLGAGRRVKEGFLSVFGQPMKPLLRFVLEPHFFLLLLFLIKLYLQMHLLEPPAQVKLFLICGFRFLMLT